MNHRLISLVFSLAAVWVLSGCATPLTQGQPAQAAQVLPERWQAPWPHAGQTAELADWWRAQHEPELVTLIEAAQRLSPDVASALARIEQARAQQVAARASVLPQWLATASGSRTLSPVQRPALTQLQAGVQMSWELDLAGVQHVADQAAQAQWESAQAQWHDARVLVAAEVATLYHGLRSCTQQQALAQEDARAQAQSVELTQLALNVGMNSRTDLALAQTAAAQSRSRAQQQQAQCDVQFKALTALSGLPETELRQGLAAALLREGTPTPLALPAIPAQTLAQRPDVFSAEREVLQAQARLTQTQATRWPRLSLQGFIGPARAVTGGVADNGLSWSFGPLSLSLPIWDAGQRAAQVQADDAQLRAALSAYQARVRHAVREVEEALVQLHSAELRWQEARSNAERLHTVLQTQNQQRTHGLISQRDWLISQRQAWAADAEVLDLQRQRQEAWIGLYRAAGGGFVPERQTPAS